MIQLITPCVPTLVIYWPLPHLPGCHRFFHSPLAWHSRRLPAVRDVQTDCHWRLKNVANSRCPWEPIMQQDNPKLYLDQPITKAWCQSIEDNGSYPTNNPVATRLVLCSSLWMWAYEEAQLMITSWDWHAFSITGPLWGKSTGGLHLQRATNGEHWYFLCCSHK